MHEAFRVGFEKNAKLNKLRKLLPKTTTRNAQTYAGKLTPQKTTGFLGFKGLKDFDEFLKAGGPKTKRTKIH